MGSSSGLDPVIQDFFAGGAEDEVTLRANEAAFARIGLLPRLPGGPAARDLSVELLDATAAMPVVIAPTAFHRLAHPGGEAATARAAARAGIVMIASMAATMPIEEITAAGGEVWFQLYVQADEAFTHHLVHRAEAAGCTALVVTVDSPVFGRRERDLRNGFLDLPPGLSCANLDGRPIEFVPHLSWEHLDRLRAATRLPIVLKGVMRPDDAGLAVEAGAAALIVSNHGGRQLDTVPAAIDLLPAVAEAVAGRVPLLMDGGVRRGTDVVKALARGAAAAGIGRPVIWGLAADGERGAARVLAVLRDELEQALARCGCRCPGEVTGDLLC